MKDKKCKNEAKTNSAENIDEFSVIIDLKYYTNLMNKLNSPCENSSKTKKDDEITGKTLSDVFTNDELKSLVINCIRRELLYPSIDTDAIRALTQLLATISNIESKQQDE